MANNSTSTVHTLPLTDIITRAELSDIISQLRVKATKHRDADLAILANRLIMVHNIGLPSTGHLTKVSCFSDWMKQEGFSSVSDVARTMGWYRGTLAELVNDTEMQEHVMIEDKLYRRYKRQDKKAGS